MYQGTNEFHGEFVRAVDGDTIELNLDLGFKVYHVAHIRLLGIDCPELRDPNGKEAKAFVEECFAEDKRCAVITTGSRSFTRWIGSVYVGGYGGKNLRDALIDAGFSS